MPVLVDHEGARHGPGRSVPAAGSATHVGSRVVVRNPDRYGRVRLLDHPMDAEPTMTRCLTAMALLCATATFTPAAFAALTQAEIDQILADHNAVRSAVSPTAANMTRLVWDPALATVAQGWVNQCIWGHNASAGTEYAQLSPNPGGVGENVFVTTSSRASALAGSGSAVALWAGEVTNYTYASNTCASGQVCGHYTQLVWANTLRVGCAINQCASLSGLTGFSNAQFLACDYNPAGNFVGQWPYVQGPTGSQCPASLPNNVNGLCSPAAPTPAADVPELPTVLAAALALLLAVAGAIRSRAGGG